MAGWTEDTLRAYLAGWIDTDGSVGIHKNIQQVKYTIYIVKVCLYNNHLQSLKFIQKHFGGTIHARNPHPQRFAKQIQYTLVWQAKKAATDILRKVLPYLIVKLEQAKTAIEMYDKNEKDKFNSHLDKSWKEKYYQKAKILNHRKAG